MLRVVVELCDQKIDGAWSRFRVKDDRATWLARDVLQLQTRSFSSVIQVHNLL
jgi:hypothetical protein